MSETKAIQTQRSLPSAETERVYIPRVDICETADHFTVKADMPGVDGKSVEATVHNRVLTIEGWSRPEKPEEHETLGQEFGCGRYRRDFTLPDTVDSERIQARVKHGVLSVTLPKREEVKARKIQVTG